MVKCCGWSRMSARERPAIHSASEPWSSRMTWMSGENAQLDSSVSDELSLRTASIAAPKWSCDRALGMRSLSPKSVELVQHTGTCNGHRGQHRSTASSDLAKHLKRLGYNEGVPPDTVKCLQSLGYILGTCKPERWDIWNVHESLVQLCCLWCKSCSDLHRCVKDYSYKKN